MTEERAVSRADLEQIPAGTALLRQLRHYTATQLAQLTDDELDQARRWLLAASYSALEGARAMDRALQHRQALPRSAENGLPTCSTSDPNTTPANTSAPAPPPASAASAPKSRSTRETKTPS